MQTHLYSLKCFADTGDCMRRMRIGGLVVRPRRIRRASVRPRTQRVCATNRKKNTYLMFAATCVKQKKMLLRKDDMQYVT